MLKPFQMLDQSKFYFIKPWELSKGMWGLILFSAPDILARYISAHTFRHHDHFSLMDILAHEMFDILEILSHTIAFHYSERASLSDWTSGQSKTLKKESKLLTRAFQITYFILILICRWIRLKKNIERQFLGSKLLF